VVGFRSGGIKVIRDVVWWASIVRGELVASVLYLWRCTHQQLAREVSW
jgi:hypothetical protein